MERTIGKKSWSIYGRSEITSKYAIEEKVGSGAYSDVYRARRISDSTIVALKEVHDHQSAYREIDALTRLHASPNVVVLHEYFTAEGEDAVLVLEYLKSDLATVIKEGKRHGMTPGERKQWMLQILNGVAVCHRNNIMHRDLKPGNLLIRDDGVLKLADFGQARILSNETGFNEEDDPRFEEAPEVITDSALHEFMSRDEYFREMSRYKSHGLAEDGDKAHDGGTSCLATGTASDIGDEILHSGFPYEAEEPQQCQPALTSWVGTRWFRAPELLFGSTDYGTEIDLWSLGCIFAELFTFQPLFNGSSDIDQLGKIISVMGNVKEEVWPGCSNLPDFNIISFGQVDNPKGLDACLPNVSPEEAFVIKKLLCYHPASRTPAFDLLCDGYFTREPFPVPVSSLPVPHGDSTELTYDYDMETPDSNDWD